MSAKTVSMCAGCHNDFYNGNNGLGVKRCWSFESATVEKRMMIHIDVPPPYKQKPQTVLSCFKPRRMVNVKPENLTKEGYWK